MNMKIDWLGENRGYEETLALQESLWSRAVSEVDFEPHLLLLEHEPVYTMGRARDQSSLRDKSHLPYKVVEINRGGQATYHGPGQLVGYPIVSLERLGRDVHSFVHALECCLIEVCRDYGVTARQREGLVGVWVEDRKLASIGVGVRKWATMHGFALNLRKESLRPFSRITPCGLNDVVMTCLEGEIIRAGGEAPAPGSEEFGRKFARQFERFLEGQRQKFAGETGANPL